MVFVVIYTLKTVDFALFIVCCSVCVRCRRLVQNCSNITDLNLTGCRRVTNVYVSHY